MSKKDLSEWDPFFIVHSYTEWSFYRGMIYFV